MTNYAQTMKLNSFYKKGLKPKFFIEIKDFRIPSLWDVFLLQPTDHKEDIAWLKAKKLRPQLLKRCLFRNPIKHVFDGGN